MVYHARSWVGWNPFVSERTCIVSCSSPGKQEHLGMLGLCFTARSMSAVSLLSLKMLEPPHASSVNSDIHKMNIYIYILFLFDHL